MKEDRKTGRATASFEELAYSNMLVVQALVELLTERGLLNNAELMQRVQKLRKETNLSFSKQVDLAQPLATRAELLSIPMVVTAGDLIAANMIAVEALLALLVDKAFLTQAEMEELVAELKQKAAKIIPRKQ